MLESDLRILRNGLWEIEAALRRQEFPLIALSETTLCFTGCLQGRWKCTWWKMSTFTTPPPSIKKTLALVGRLLDRAVEELASAKTDYWKELTLPLPKHLPQLRRRILDLSEILFPFWEHFTIESSVLPGTAQFLSYMESSRFLCDRTTFSLLYPLPVWVEIEAYTHQNIPLSLLLQGRGENSWSPTEKRQVLHWARALQKESLITQNKMILFFESLEILAKSKQLPDFSLGHLLLFLHHNGIKKWMGKDLFYLHWRVRLTAGTLLQTGDRTLTVGLPLEKEHSHNHFLHFTVQEEPQLLIRCGYSRLINRFDAMARESLQFGIRGPAVSTLDQEARFQLVSKLSQPMLTYTWKSSDWRLLPEEEQTAAMLSNHLYHQVRENFSLDGVSIKHLFLDGTPSVLRSCCVVTKKTACYLEWEKFACLIAKGNLPILDFIVHVSHLSHHPLYLYFRKIGHFSLKTGKTNLLSTSLPIDWKGSSYSVQAEALAVSAVQIRKQVIERIQHSNLTKEAPTEGILKEVEERVSALLVSLYEAYPLPSSLPMNLLEEAEKQWNEGGKKITPPLSERNPYYREHHQKVQSRNKKALSVKST